MAGKARRPTSKKNPHSGTGGHNVRRLEGKGPTPPAEARKGHPKARAAARKANTGPKITNRPESADRLPGGGSRTAARPGRAEDGSEVETVVGRNPVLEALRAKVPGNRLYVALGIDVDDRVREAVLLAQKAGIDTVEVERRDLDRITSEALHQGLALNVPPYAYLLPEDLIAHAMESGEAPLLVALDGVTDPRNLGASVRSAAAFGAHGLIVPERRAAGITASAWRTSAGAVARLPVAQATNLTRTLVACKKSGLFVVGLAADGEATLDDLELATDGLVIVAGSEGKGLGRLVSETCDVLVSIPMAGPVESLNASVAVSVALAEVARRRRVAAN